jgi:hypothetical protein
MILMRLLAVVPFVRAAAKDPTGLIDRNVSHILLPNAGAQRPERATRAPVR